MDIFMHVEISARELDSKVLLGLVAAGRGHRAMVCDFPTLMRWIARKGRAPRFVHLKDLEPSKAKHHFHRIFRAARCNISSLDEEAGTMRVSYADFARARFVPETVSTTDAVFCWGDRDYKALVSRFPDQAEKFFRTGSPRVDLWSPKFSGAYQSIVRSSPKPFVVVCTTAGLPMGWYMPYELIATRRRSLQPAPNDWSAERKLISEYGYSVSMMLDYLDLIRFLSARTDSYDILVKPHPVENPSAWQMLLHGLEGVSVTDSPTSALIRQSRAVITSLSTTAIEAAFSGTPVVVYGPTSIPDMSTNLLSSLGAGVSTREEVASVLDSLVLDNSNPISQVSKLPNAVKARFYSSQKMLAAERIVRVWEEVASKNSRVSEPRLTIADVRYWVLSAFPRIAPVIASLTRIKRAPSSNLVKYPPVNRRELVEKIDHMANTLGLQGRVRYRFIGKRNVLFEPVTSFRFGPNIGGS